MGIPAALNSRLGTREVAQFKELTAASEPKQTGGERVDKILARVDSSEGCRPFGD